MAIEIVITGQSIADKYGISLDELNEQFREFNEQYERGLDSGRRPRADVGSGKYRYTQGDSKSGICEICAPFVGMLTDGTGDDGVPVPPLHINCVCSLTPVDTDEIEDEGGGEQYAWLKGLSLAQLADVIGKQRARLVAEGRLSIEDLYDSDGMLRRVDRLPDE